MGQDRIQSLKLVAIQVFSLLCLGATALAQTADVSFVIEAEQYAQLNGVTFDPPGDFLAVEGFGSGDWISFDSVNFAEGIFDSITLMYWCSWPNDGSNATVRIRLDSPTGTTIGTISPVPSAGDRLHTTSFPVSTSLSAATGVHDLYLTFEGGSSILDLDRIRLSGTVTVDPADAKTYYVSTTGSDGNDGLSLENPFQTISKAASVMKPGSRCQIRQGIYRETVKPLYAGVSGAELTFEAYNNELVYISGADPVTGWSQHEGNIYKATMDWSMGKYKNQVIVDGDMAWMARCPNVDEDYTPHPWLGWCGGGFGVYDWTQWHDRTDPIAVPMRACWGASGSDNTFSASVSDDDPPNQLPSELLGRNADFFQGGIVTLHSFYWQSVGEITGSQSTTNSTTVNATKVDLVAPTNGGPGWVSHVLGLLDSPNEWYLDESSNTLYLWAPRSDNPTNHLVEAKRRDLGFDLRGKQYVNLTNIRFIATSLSMAHASYCIVDGCHFRYVSHNDVPPDHEMGTTFEIRQDASPGHLGIAVSGNENIIRNSSVRGSASSGIIVGGSYNKITNCRITACDYSVTYHAGILVIKRDWKDPDDAKGIEISHNSINYCARGNIQVGSATSPDIDNVADRIKIKYNDFGAAAYTTVETGSIAGQAANRVEVSHNWFHDVGFTGVGNMAMESDFGAWAWKVHHNVFWQGQGPVAQDPRGFDWTFTTDDLEWMCFNNTVVDPVGEGGHSDWEYMCSFLPGTQTIDTSAHWPNTLNRNVNNLWPQDTAYLKFSNPANRDYSLRSGSPAIDAGKVVPGWVEDFQGSAPDLGAYEYGEPRWVAGADWDWPSWDYPPPPEGVTARGPFGTSPTACSASLRVLNRQIILNLPRGLPSRVTIHNAKGALVFTRAHRAGGACVIETNSFPVGVYAVRLSGGNTTRVWKTLIRR